MNLRRPIALAAALIAAASFTGGTALAATAAPATIRPNFIAYDDGYGATALAAKQDAISTLHGDYYGCTTPYLVFDNQQSDGSWWAEVEANCKGYN